MGDSIHLLLCVKHCIYLSNLHHVLELVLLAGLYLPSLLSAPSVLSGNVARHVESVAELLVDDLLVEFCELVHERGLVVVDLVAAAHDLLDLLLVGHQVGQVVEHVLHLVHVELLHLLGLHGRGLLQGVKGLNR